MIKTIFLRQVLEKLEEVDEKRNTKFFEIEFRTYNANNKSGGSLKILKGRLLKKNNLKGKVFNPFEHEFRTYRSRSNPNHWENLTRNIELETSGMIRKLKIRYITKFNGVEVVY